MKKTYVVMACIFLGAFLIGGTGCLSTRNRRRPPPRRPVHKPRKPPRHYRSFSTVSFSVTVPGTGTETFFRAETV